MASNYVTEIIPLQLYLMEKFIILKIEKIKMKVIGANKLTPK